MPLRCSSRNLQFLHRLPFFREKMPWCPCPFKKRIVFLAETSRIPVKNGYLILVRMILSWLAAFSTLWNRAQVSMSGLTQWSPSRLLPVWETVLHDASRSPLSSVVLTFLYGHIITHSTFKKSNTQQQPAKHLHHAHTKTQIPGWGKKKQTWAAEGKKIDSS